MSSRRLNKPTQLIKIATLGYNFALGFSCFHTAVVNSILLPRPLRGGWLVRAGLILSGVFFILLGSAAAYQTVKSWDDRRVRWRRR